MSLITSDTSFCHGKRDSSYFIINHEKSTLKSFFSSTFTEPSSKHCQLLHSHLLIPILRVTAYLKNKK